MGAEISVIIPVYNEAKNVHALVHGISSSLKGIAHEIIFVDDGSTDGTGGKIREMRKRGIIYINRGSKKGLSSAVVCGLVRASGKYVCVMDGDLQHDPKYIPELYRRARSKKGSIVIGSRFTGGVRNVQRHDSKLGTFICRHVLGVRARDPLSGFFMLERGRFAELAKGINPIGYKILLELLARGRFKNVVEVPIVFGMRNCGSSKLDLKTRVEFLKQITHLIFLGT